MEHGSSFLQSGVVFLIAAVFMVPLAKRLQLGAVLGYLLAGVLIGPSVLGLVDNPESVAQISEMGVVLLLFIIGLELSPRRLWVMRKSVFGVGLLQVLLTGVVIGTVALVGFDQPVNSAVVLGLGLALSSTAFGLQILAERKELTQPHGRLAFAILLFQDIAAIPLIAMIPLLSGAHSDAGGSELTQTLKVVGSIAAVVVGGRYLLRPVFRIVAQTKLQDMSTATALLVVMGTALLMELAGVSMALGAFLAGLLLADSEYRHELEAQIEPFKGLLLGLFFISVGMSADISLLLKSPWMVLGLTVLLIALKAPVLYFVGRISGGLDKASALRLGVVLAAGGEFAFVVFKMARDQGLFQNDLHNLLVLSITPVDGPDPVAGTRPRAPAGEGAGGDEAAAGNGTHRQRRHPARGDRRGRPHGPDRRSRAARPARAVHRPGHLGGDHRADPYPRRDPDLLRRPDAPGDPSRGPGREGRVLRHRHR